MLAYPPTNHRLSKRAYAISTYFSFTTVYRGLCIPVANEENLSLAKLMN